MDSISLACPSCGSNLEVTKDLERFACGYCGKQLLINRTGGIVSIKPIVEKLDSIGVAVDKTASELAINRLKGEISEIEATLNDANSRKSSIWQSATIGIVGIIVSLVGFVFGLSNQNSTVFFCGVLPLIITGAYLFFSYYARKGWNKDIEKIQKKLKEKQTQLKKHMNIVNS